jgi:NADPH-dependent 2,4-dienoyl-CoA reductase/sulfur reductase-like enzyme
MMAMETYVYSTNGINEINMVTGPGHPTNGINWQNEIKSHMHSTNGINRVNGAYGHHGLADHAYHANGEIPVETPVLIVGGGPTGLLLAHLLSRLGG